MTSWQNTYSDKLLSLESAVHKIQSGDKIWVGGVVSTPVLFLKELDKHLTTLTGCELYSGLMTTPYEFLKPQYKKNIKHISLFMGPVERKIQQTGNVEIINFHFSNFSKVLERIQVDTVVIETTPPNSEGYMSLGACGGIGNRLALQSAQKVIFVINEQQPFIGNSENLVHVDEATYLVEGHHSIAFPKPTEPTSIEKDISKHVIPYIQDGSTIQIGIGNISNAIGMLLKDRKNLGIHTEMFTESLMELCKFGVANGTKKSYKPNKIVVAFSTGSQDVIDFLHNNPAIEMKDIHDVVNCHEVAKNDNFISINNCIMVDLTGQIASEGVGFSQISGSGGQVDFVRGANLAKNGLSILTLSSVRKTDDGMASNIRLALPIGTPVTTSRNDVHVIITEYGKADLRGLTNSERVQALINIAHPDFRESLLAEATQHNLIR